MTDTTPESKTPTKYLLIHSGYAAAGSQGQRFEDDGAPLLKHGYAPPSVIYESASEAELEKIRDHMIKISGHPKRAFSILSL